MTTLVIAPGRGIYSDCVFNLLVLETGEHLASHLCSQSGFAPGDLYFNRPERIEKYKERFGDVEVKFIDDVEIDDAELRRRNKSWYDGIITDMFLSC